MYPTGVLKTITFSNTNSQCEGMAYLEISIRHQYFVAKIITDVLSAACCIFMLNNMYLCAPVW